MNYGIYKNVRNAAWHCLIGNGAAVLPVDPVEIAATAGVEVIANSDVGLLSGGVSGLCVLAGGNRWFLVYDDESSVERQRFVIAHELGHIFLGHELLEGRSGRVFRTDKPQAEREADAFAIRLLTPACVLRGLNLRTADEIARWCSIPRVEAAKRARRMAALYQRDAFGKQARERALYEQFRGFVERNRLCGSTDV